MRGPHFKAPTADTSWQAAANCRGVAVDLMFPEDGDPDPALALCARCEVREACLEYAMGESIQWGIWGGLGPGQRRRLRRRRNLERRQAAS